MSSPLQADDELVMAVRISAWLKRLRKEFGLAQVNAGEIAGVSRNTLSRWERAETLPTLVQVERLKTFEKNQRRADGISAPARPPFAKAATL